MKYQHIIFDLDGTLTDSGPGIRNAVRHALKKYGIEEKREALYRFIGPPLKLSFMKYYSFSEERSEEAVVFYREYFKDKGIFENTVYPDIDDMLSQLKERGKSLILATSKPHIFAKRILEHFDLMKYFDLVSGSELNGDRVDKSEVISYALDNISLPSRDSCVMVGDREHDIIGARKNGIMSVGVLYGYGDRNELEASRADRIVGSVAELKSLLLSL